MTLVYNKLIFKERRRELRRGQTDAETALWKQLRNKGFMGLKFFRQYSVGAYIIDFYCPEHKLAIELDGGQHAEEQNREYDRLRTDFLVSKGIQVVRFWNNELLQNMSAVLAEINNRLSPASSDSPPSEKTTPPDPLFEKKEGGRRAEATEKWENNDQ